MKAYPPSIANLIQAFSKFPGIGPRSAERMVFYLLKSEPQESHRMADLIVRVKEHTFFCSQCFNLSEAKLCHICTDENRNPEELLVVEDPKDVIAFEKAGTFRGYYHVLLGSLSPQEGIGPDEIRLKELLQRVDKGTIKEVILGTSARSEGEATVLYISELMKNRPVTVTRIARGVSVGHTLEFTDQATLARALEGRHAVKS